MKNERDPANAHNVLRGLPQPKRKERKKEKKYFYLYTIIIAFRRLYSFCLSLSCWRKKNALEMTCIRTYIYIRSIFDYIRNTLKVYIYRERERKRQRIKCRFFFIFGYGFLGTPFVIKHVFF